jgi:glucuronate isomerase
MTGTPALAPHPDRLFPADPGIRAVARRLYELVAGAHIVSPHGHVDPQVLLDDEPFSDPAALLITPDHYITRLLNSRGVDLADLGVGEPGASEPARRADPRAIWRILCEHWADFRATPSRYWLESELADLFGITARPSAATADAIYDQIAGQLATPEFRPRALFSRFGIDVLATTDDPADDLAAHDTLAGTDLGGRVLPTFRADRFIDPGEPTWRRRVTDLAAVADVDTGSYAGLLRALNRRRAYFRQHGATATDTGVLDAGTEPLSDIDAERLHAAALTGPLSPADSAAYRRNMLYQQGIASAEDGLVMQLHPGVLRDHHRPTAARFGRDIGADIPVTVEFTRALRPLLEKVGTAPAFRLVLFTVDETVFSREVAPLAGFYPSVYAGAPWWFLDTPDAITRYRSAVTDTIGFSKVSGFIDDTRAFCSIPARHDMSRRVDAGHLARLVTEHRLDEDEAADTIVDLAGPLPTRVFRLG